MASSHTSLMAGRHQTTAAFSLGVAAALYVSALLVANVRKNRGHGGSRIARKTNQENVGVDLSRAAVPTDRRAPEDDEQVFSLFESVDAEPHDPPMELSRSVLALLESFDVDPVRGESCSRARGELLWCVFPPCHRCKYCMRDREFMSPSVFAI